MDGISLASYSVALGLLLALPASYAQAVFEVTRDDAAAKACAAAASAPHVRLPDGAALLAGSTPASGAGDLQLAWLSGPSDRYRHAALGNHTHATALHALLRDGRQVVRFQLPADRVFEDRLPRLADLDGDGADEIIVIEAHVARGASLVVYGMDRSGSSPRLVERARSQPVGLMRWLNPVGVADFDGDGKPDIAAVHTPHIGGVLTLYRYAPPHLAVLGQVGGVSNHRMGSAEQRLSTVLPTPEGPVVVVPGQDDSRLSFLRWDGRAGWTPAAAPLALEAKPARVLPHGRSVCVELATERWLRISVP